LNNHDTKDCYVDPANAAKYEEALAKWEAQKRSGSAQTSVVLSPAVPDAAPTVPRPAKHVGAATSHSSHMIDCYYCCKRGHIKMHCPKNLNNPNSALFKSGGVPAAGRLGGLAQDTNDYDPFCGQYDSYYLANFAGDMTEGPSL
jgi:hypothetical protein